MINFLRKYIQIFAEFLINNSRKTAIEFKKQGMLIVGDKTYGWQSLVIDEYYSSEAKVIIGKYCSLSKNIRIITGGIHPTNWISTFPLRIHFNHSQKYSDGLPTTKGNVVIGNDVWIGTDVTILSGVRIGNGAVVAAGSVVSKDIEPYSIVGGNPARLIRFRFDNDVIERLLMISWWDWEDVKVIDNIEYLSSNNITDFLRSYSEN